MGPGEDESSGPTKINVKLYVRDFQYVDILKMEMGLQITFRQKWLDPRLQYTPPNVLPATNTTYITLPTDQKIWKPDTFFRNEVSGRRHSVLGDNSYIRLFPDGHLLTSTRLTLDLICPMDMSLYPFDKQTCPLQLASYGGHKETIEYVWKSLDPVMTVMVPSCMWIVVAWLALWLNRDQLVGRIFLVCLSLYALSEIARQVNAEVPGVAYTKVAIFTSVPQAGDRFQDSQPLDICPALHNPLHCGLCRQAQTMRQWGE